MVNFTSQYNDPEIARGFKALGLGREKAAIGAKVTKFVTDNYRDIPNATAVILGGGAGWEIRLLKGLGFRKIGFYEPADEMRAQAEALVQENKYGKDVQIFGTANLDKMVKKFGSRADFVLSSHVIPALETEEHLKEHFKDFERFLRVGGNGLAVTNDPDTQFHYHDTYICLSRGNKPTTQIVDGMPITSVILDVKIGGREISDPVTKEKFTYGGRALAVEDTYWSSAAIAGAVRDAALQPGDALAIYLLPEDRAEKHIHLEGAERPHNSAAIFPPYKGFVMHKIA